MLFAYRNFGSNAIFTDGMCYHITRLGKKDGRWVGYIQTSAASPKQSCIELEYKNYWIVFVGRQNFHLTTLPNNVVNCNMQVVPISQFNDKFTNREFIMQHQIIVEVASQQYSRSTHKVMAKRDVDMLISEQYLAAPLICAPTAIVPDLPTKLDIKDIITIDGTDSTLIKDEKLLELILVQQQLIENLSVIRTKSAAIDRQRTKHQHNIESLIQILDSRY